MSGGRVLVWSAVLSATSLAVLWGTFLPLGIPGEWAWLRIPFAVETVWGWIVAVTCAALYVGFVRIGADRMAVASRRSVALWLTGLTAAGFAWLWIVQDSPPLPYRLSKAPFVLYYPASSGYFFKARYEVRDTTEFLAGYEELMSQGDVLHVGTHPPGLFLAYRGLMGLVEHVPVLVNLAAALEPESASQAFDVIGETEAGRAPLLPQDRAVLWLSVLLVQLAAAAAVVPLYLIVQRLFDRQTSWWVASLWPTIPALAIFLPKSDALYPLFGLLLVWSWIEGWCRRSIPLSGLSGLLLFTGLMFSLAILPALVLAGVLTLWEGWCCRPVERVPQSGRKLLIGLAMAAVAFVLPVFLFWLVWDVNLPAVWSWNYRNHAGFYDQFPRTYWKWLLVNPLELSLALGVPIVCAAVSSCWQLARHDPTSRRAGWCWGSLMVWGLLWLSGKNMGEAARLWLFLMPWGVWSAAEWIGAHRRPDAGVISSKVRLSPVVLLLMLQLIVCVFTVTRVSGFHFGQH